MRIEFSSFCMVLVWFMLHCRPERTKFPYTEKPARLCSVGTVFFAEEFWPDLTRWNCHFRKGEFEFEENNAYRSTYRGVKKIIGFKVTDRKTDSLTLDWYVRREKPENGKFNFIYGKEIHSFKTVYANKERRSGLYRLFLLGNDFHIDDSYELIYE